MPFRLSNHLHGQFSQCYFVHRHPQQYIIQATSFSNLAIISSKAFFLNKLPVKEKNYCFQSYLHKKSCRDVLVYRSFSDLPFSSPASAPVFTYTSQIFTIFRRILFQYSYLSATTLACLTCTHKHSIVLFQ